ncbi:hypothetical protein BT96DRAFT_916973, partial [Gymnopus androsaceus JB14]
MLIQYALTFLIQSPHSLGRTVSAFSKSPDLHFVLAKTWILASEGRYGTGSYKTSIMQAIFGTYWHACDTDTKFCADDANLAWKLNFAVRDLVRKDGVSLSSFIANRISDIYRKNKESEFPSEDAVHQQVEHLLDGFCRVIVHCSDVFRETLQPGNLDTFSYFLDLLVRINTLPHPDIERAVEPSRLNCLRYIYRYFEHCFDDGSWWIEKAVAEGFLLSLANTAVLLRQPNEHHEEAKRAAEPFYKTMPRILTTIHRFMVYNGVANQVVTAVKEIMTDEKLALIFLRNGLSIGAAWQTVEAEVTGGYNITMREISRLQRYESPCSNNPCNSKIPLIEHKACSKCHVAYYCSKEC